MKEVIEMWKTFEILRSCMSVLLCSDKLILFISSSQESFTWKKLLITVNTWTDLILLCPFPAEESSFFWEKLYKTELNKSSCESQGVCHLPGCDAQLKHEQRAPERGWETPALWTKPGNNSHIKCYQGPKKGSEGTRAQTACVYWSGSTRMIPQSPKQVKRCVCTALLFQSASRIPQSLKWEEGKWCRRGKEKESVKQRLESH